MNLENMLSGKKNSNKTTYCIIPIIGMFRIGKSKETEGQLVVA